MIARLCGGEDRFPRTTEKQVPQHPVGAGARQQILTPIVARGAGQQRVAVGHRGAFEPFRVEAEQQDDLMDGGEHRPGHVVGVDLITGHQQQRGATVALAPGFLW